MSLVVVATLTSCADDPTKDHGKGSGKFTVGLTYTPDIQFAPFYVAAAKGYYKEEDLNVSLRHHGAAEDEFGAIKSGKEDLIYAGGDEMMQARSKDIPLVDVMTLYQQYPVALIVPKDSDIHEASDLKGRKLGTPGEYGETYFGLLALLKEAGLSPKDANVQYIGFTQQAALAGKKVDGVMGYMSNDAVSFEEAGLKVRSIPLATKDAGETLVGVGLGGTEKTLKKRGDETKKFVYATLRGLEYTMEHPKEAVKLSQKYVPNLKGDKQRKNALAVLAATKPLMTNTDEDAGHNDPQTWGRMADFMYSQGLLDKPVEPSSAFTNDYLPK